MSRNNRVPKGKKINPTFFVFCEGETEEQYICYLRSKYRLPILIDPKISGNGITERYIKNYKRDKTNHPKDKTYLVYDIDVPNILKRLQSIKNVKLLSSNPCFEFWYLLHYQEHNSYITSTDCLDKLIYHHKNYKKGFFDNSLKVKITERQDKAIHRAMKLEEFENPSTQIYQFINDLEEVEKNKYL